MATLIELSNGDIETLCSENDFSRLIENHMGLEAAEYFNDILEELDRYREEDRGYDQQEDW